MLQCRGVCALGLLALGLGAEGFSINGFVGAGGLRAEGLRLCPANGMRASLVMPPASSTFRKISVHRMLANPVEGSEEAEGQGFEPPTRKRKEVPAHVREVLEAATVKENPLENLYTADDFQGIDYEKQPDQQVEKAQLFVKGLPWALTSQQLKQKFSAYGTTFVKIMTDPKNPKKSLGFGFVHFKSEKGAAQAIKDLDQSKMSVPGDKSGKQTTISLSYSTVKRKQRVLTSQKGKRAWSNEIAQRKQILSARDMSKTADSFDDMPRRWKAMADRSPVKPQMTSSVTDGDESLDDKAAEQAIQEFLQHSKIEDVSESEFREEVKQAKEANDPSLDVLFANEVVDKEGDDNEDDADWVFVPDDTDQPLEYDEEEERKNWEEYQKMMNEQKNK